MNRLPKSGQADAEVSTERMINIRHDVAKAADAERGDKADDELEDDRLRIHQEDSKKGEETQDYQKHPSGKYICSISFLHYRRSDRNILAYWSCNQ